MNVLKIGNGLKFRQVLEHESRLLIYPRVESLDFAFEVPHKIVRMLSTADKFELRLF